MTPDEGLPDARSRELLDRFRLAVRGGQFDEAEQWRDELAGHDPATAAHPLLDTALAVARGRAVEALRDLDDDASPELRAVCLQAIGDPTWEGLAERLARDDAVAPGVREAMNALLGRGAG